MNIFILDYCPEKSTHLMVDAHTRGKMITETAQILSNAYSLERLAAPDCPKSQKGLPRKHSYPFHPCCKWVSEGLDNFKWVAAHGFFLQKEKNYRFGHKEHFSTKFIKWCINNPPNLPNRWTTPALAMKQYPECMDYNDPVGSYRAFYEKDKRFDRAGRPMDVWTRRKRPKWFPLKKFIMKSIDSIFESIQHEYSAKAMQLVNDISIAVVNPISIPDHFDFSSDIKKKIEELDKQRSLVETVQFLRKTTKEIGENE